MFVAEWVQSVAGQEVGYYSCVCGCVALGLALMPVMIKLVRSVETLPLSDWRVQVAPTGDYEMSTAGYKGLSSEEAVAGEEHCD